MSKKLVAIIFFSGLIIGVSHISALAQLYRPPVNWYELNTEHFRVIFHEGNDSLAQVSARLLEYHYQPIQKLTSGKLNRFPVVLNAYNDQSNGYVTPYNFRMEVEISFIKGKILNPRAGGWLENVLPHELVHAQHFSVVPALGLGGLIYPFWPDAARSLHFSAPVGFHEGLAVYYESEILKDESGRGNFPFFTNQINSVFSSSGRWSFGQLLNSVEQVRPNDRHYQGGYEFINWVEQKHGEKAARDLIDFVNRWPIFGFGVAYWYQMSQWPGTGFREYQQEKIQNERSRQTEIRAQNLVEGIRLNTEAEGESIRRPQWLNDSTLLVFGQFYDKKSGFFTLDTKTSKLKRLLTTGSVEDFKTDLKSDKSAFLFARYDVHPKWDNTFISNVYEYDFQSQSTRKIGSKNTTLDRVYNPIYVDDVVWAYQNKGTTNSLVEVANNEIKLVYNPGNNTLVDMDFSENTHELALVANVNGMQGLWISLAEDLDSILQRKPDIAFDSGSIYDPTWDDLGTKIIFTSDHSGTANVYEFDREKQQIVQLTNSLFNAFEANISEKTGEMSFVLQHDNEQQISILNQADFLNSEVDSALWKNQIVPENRYWQAEKDTSVLYKKKMYSNDGSWLRPRAVLPGFETGTHGDKYSAVFLGTDVLQKHTYFAEVDYQYKQIWYDISYRYTGTWPGFEFKATRKPIPFFFNTTELAFLSESVYSIGIPFVFNIDQNVSYSGLSLKPSFKLTNFEFAHPVTDGSAQYKRLINNKIEGMNWSLGFNSSFYFKIVKRVRDLQPSEGFIFNTQLDLDLTNNSLYELYQGTEKKRLGIIGELYAFVPNPLVRNHSLRLGSRILYQPWIQAYNILDFVKNTGADTNFLNSEQIIELSSRYTFPIVYSETGGFLIPWYLQNVYGVLFTRSHINEKQISNTQFGVGLRYTTGLGNIRLDLGISYVINTSNNFKSLWAGDF